MFSILAFEKANSETDNNFGYLFVKFDGVCTFRLPVIKTDKGTWINIPGQWKDSKMRAWFSFENPSILDQIKKQGVEFIKKTQTNT